MKVRRPIRGKPNFRPETINPVRPGAGIGAIINPIRQPGPISTFNSTPFPRGGQQPGPISTFNSTPFPRGGQQQPIQIQPGFAVDPIRQPGGMGPLPNNFGPMQGQVGDPRLGAATIPGNQAQMMMRGTTQAAPVQPVPAMKKGGVVRGGRAEIKGTRPAKIT